jgi:glycosyltransferase involved in cell wall biosynthesis
MYCHILFAPEPGNATESPELQLNARDIARQGFDVVCFQKVHGPSAIALAHALRTEGVATVFLVCDTVNAAMCDATDVTAAVTDFLRNEYPPALQHKVCVVHDGIERPEIQKSRTTPDRSKPLLDAVLVTSAHLTEVPVIGIPPAWLRVSIVGPYAANRLRRLREDCWTWQRLHGWRERWSFLHFLFSRRIRRVTWSSSGVYDELVKADIGVIPVRTDALLHSTEAPAPRWKKKSENRLTLKMAIGLPVVATPIPAYEAVVRQGVNGYLATSRTSWLDALGALRTPALRERIGIQAQKDVLARFSMQAQAKALAAAFRKAQQTGTQLRIPKHE